MSDKKNKKKSWKRRAAIAGAVSVVSMGGFFVCLHAFPGFGPAMADGARAVLGPGPVAWAEDAVYGIEDRVKRVVYSDAPPKTFWEAPAATASTPDEPKVASNARDAPSVYEPAPFAPPYANVASSADGKWIAADATDAPIFYKTIVHPDEKRSYAAVAVVAMDLSRVRLSLVPGTIEPVSLALPREKRSGVVPKDQYDALLAAFNGGFKVEHGHYGMMISGTTLVAPRDISCTVAIYKGDAVRVATWTSLKETASEMTAWRQTPPCLVEGGAVNEKLVESDASHGWGAAVDGQTVIRRSAIGIDKERRTLFYALGDSVTAGALARAMLAAGADSAAQLDVNAAYPRFLFYSHAEPTPKVASALIPDIRYAKHEYLNEPEGRDFFYVTKRTSD